MRHESVSWRELGLVVGSFALASFVLTMPLGQHPTRTLPSDLLDTLLTTWIIAWDADRLRHGLQSVWDAPIFFPYHNTLAFSENLFGLAFLVAPVYWITGNAVLTYNVAFLFSFTLAGTGMYLLVHALTGSRAAAAVAGVYYAFCPFRMAQAQLAHIQMLATGWLPIALWALHGYFCQFRRRWLVLFVAAYCLQSLSNIYVAYFTVLPAVAVIAASATAVRGRARRTLADLAVAGVVIVAVLAPVAVKYYRVRVDYEQIRSTGEIQEGGADVRAYFVAASGIWRRWLPLPQPIFGETEKELFPGLAAPLLAAIALWAALSAPHPLRRWVRVYALVAVAGFICSLGPLVRIWGWVLTSHGPYDWLQRLVPGMTGMRVPSRFTIVFITGVSVLAGYGASVVLARIRPSLRPIVLTILLIAVVADGWAVPIPTVRYNPRGRPEDRAVAEWLRDAPAGAVLHLPIMTYQFQELNYEYATLFHGHPLVNGFSGWSTPLQDLLRQPWAPLYDYDRFAATVRMLRSLGVGYVFLHPGDYNVTQLQNGELSRTVEGLRGSGQILREKRLLDVYAFALEPWTDAAAAATEALVPIGLRDFSASASHEPERAGFLVDGDRDTRWIGLQDGQSSIALRLHQPTDVARIELQLANRSLMDYPRELQIDAADPNGRARTLYRASPYPEFIAAFLRSRWYPGITIDLPPNETAVLTVREVASHPNWWSVHELRLWRRR